MHSDDLTQFLTHWPHTPGRINVRRIRCQDGVQRIQVRLELGVLQMELDGRPDGLRPEGATSWLDVHVLRRDRYADAAGSDHGFVLSEEECRLLREEAVQYYHRYVALFALGDFDGVIRDCTRNLTAFDFCRDHGMTEADQTLLEQFRAQVIMTRARAEAERALAGGSLRQATVAIDQGITEIRRHLEESGAGQDPDHCNELALLLTMRDALTPKLPSSQRAELEERLRAALDAENYELAAILRDELRMMKDT